MNINSLWAMLNWTAHFIRNKDHKDIEIILLLRRKTHITPFNISIENECSTMSYLRCENVKQIIAYQIQNKVNVLLICSIYHWILLLWETGSPYCYLCHVNRIYKISWKMYESVRVFLNPAIKFFIVNYYVTDAAISLLVVNKLI